MLLGIVQLIMAGLGIALLTYFDHTCDGLFSDEALNILLAALVVSQVRRCRGRRPRPEAQGVLRSGLKRGSVHGSALDPESIQF